MFSANDVLLAQLAYLSIALVEVATAYLQTFKYRKQDWNSTTTSDSFYKPYDTHVGGTNFWSLANLLNGYSKLALYGIAFLTQALTLLGIAPAINSQVWYYGIVIGVSSINALYVVLTGLAADKVADKCRQGNVTSACGIDLSEDFMLFFGLSGFSAATMYANFPAWLQGQTEAEAKAAVATEEATGEEGAEAEGDAEDNGEEKAEDDASAEDDSASLFSVVSL